MLKPYKYLYYRIYAWNLRVWGKEDVPQFNALFGVSFLLFLNFYFLNDLFGLATGIDTFKALGLRPLQAAVIYVAIVVINLLIFIKNDNYRKIAEQFGHETKVKKRVNMIWCILYVVFTFVGAFGWSYMFPSTGG